MTYRLTRDASVGDCLPLGSSGIVAVVLRAGSEVVPTPAHEATLNALPEFWAVAVKEGDEAAGPIPTPAKETGE